MQEIGIHHVLDVKYTKLFAEVWYLSMTALLVKCLCTPGIYTWIVRLLTIMLIKYKKISGLILFVPSYVNIIVCLASPLADAIRYELPAVASVPLLIVHGPELSLRPE